MSKNEGQEPIMNKLLLIFITVLITAGATWGVGAIQRSGGAEIRLSTLEQVTNSHLQDSKEAMNEFVDVKQKQAVMLENLSYMKNDIGELKNDIREIKKLMQRGMK